MAPASFPFSPTSILVTLAYFWLHGLPNYPFPTFVTPSADAPNVYSWPLLPYPAPRMQHPHPTDGWGGLTTRSSSYLFPTLDFLLPPNEFLFIKCLLLFLTPLSFHTSSVWWLSLEIKWQQIYLNFFFFAFLFFFFSFFLYYNRAIDRRVSTLSQIFILSSDIT